MMALSLLMMKFDGTITLGDLGVILTFVITGFSVYNRLSIEIAEIKIKLLAVEKWWNNCTDGNCPMARELRAQRRGEGHLFNEGD